MLINSAQTLNSQAVAMVFELLYEKLYLSAWSMLKDHQNSKDLVQETFSELMQVGVSRFKDFNDIESFLFNHVKDSCYAYLNTYKEKCTDGQLMDLLEDKGNHEQINADLLQKLKVLYNNLPKERKLLLKMQFIEGASPEEVANKMRIKTGAVHRLNYTTLRKLKLALFKWS